MIKDGKLIIQSPTSIDEGVTVYANQAGGIVISVVEEQAIDSYNVDVTCNAYLSREDAIELAAWLKAEGFG